MEPKAEQPLVQLEVTEGPMRGEVFAFERQDTFLIGRAEDCSCVVRDDPTFSRHHMLIEINHTTVMLKDLGSLNGTYVNGVKYGGRDKSVAPQDAQPSVPVGLRDGDELKAGRHVMRLRIHAPALCVDCGCEIAAEERKAAEFVHGTYLCQACRAKEQERHRRAQAPARGAVKMDVGQRQQAEVRPGQVVEQLLRQLLGLPAGQVPEIDGYTDWQKIGEGGFGAVYRARRAADGQMVAIKTMLQTHVVQRRQVRLFEREKQIASQLVHPHIVRVHRSGVVNDIHFIEMEYCNRGSVWDLMEQRRRALSLEEARPILLEVLDGLAYAHQAEITLEFDGRQETVCGVVHRDLKPPNILLSEQEGQLVAKVSDYGLAKGFGAAGLSRGLITRSISGQFCGSPPYMAPEHITSYKHVRPATDVFEVAATFFHILTGEFVWPFSPGKDPINVVLECRPRRLRDYLAGAPAGLYGVFDRALDRDPNKRYANAAEMLQAIRKVL